LFRYKLYSLFRFEQITYPAYAPVPGTRAGTALGPGNGERHTAASSTCMTQSAMCV